MCVPLSFLCFYHTENMPVRSNFSRNLHHLRCNYLTLQTCKTSNCQMLSDQNSSVLSRTTSIQHNLLRLPVSSRLTIECMSWFWRPIYRSDFNKRNNVGRMTELSMYQFGHSSVGRRACLWKVCTTLIFVYSSY